jgi:hypothetical protein
MTSQNIINMFCWLASGIQNKIIKYIYRSNM